MSKLLYLVVPVIPLLLVWGAIFYLRSSDTRSHRKKWRELARLSNLKYHPRCFAGQLRQVPGIDVPKLGSVRQAMSGQLGDTWFAVLESKVRRSSVSTTNPLGKVIPAAFCVMVAPSLNVPEFCLRKKSGRGISAALNALLESEVKLGEEFSKKYSLQGRSADELRAHWGESTQAWFNDSNPLDVEIRYSGDVEPTSYQLELHAKNQTLTLCCLDNTHRGKLSRKGGTLPARDIQQLIDRAKQIRDRLAAPALHTEQT